MVAVANVADIRAFTEAINTPEEHINKLKNSGSGQGV